MEKIADDRLSSLDLMVLVDNYKRLLVGSYIANVYGYRDLIAIKLRGISGRRFLLLEPSIRVNLTNRIYEWEHSNLVGILRRHLKNRKIIDVNQYKFDRIIRIDLTDEYSLICEVIPRGALILTRQNEIIAASSYRKMRDREIAPRVKYVYPPNPPEPIVDIPFDTFRVTISKCKDLRRGLMALGLGHKYSLEICLRAGLSPGSDVPKISESELEILYNTLRDLIREALKSKRGYIYYGGGKPLFFSPIRLRIGDKYSLKEFDDFDEAIDEFFMQKKSIIQTKELLDLMQRREKLSLMVKHQENAIEKLKTKIAKLKATIEAIYNNYRSIEFILGTIRTAKDDHGLSWEEIRARIPIIMNQVKNGDITIQNIGSDGTITLRLGALTLSTNYRATVNSIAGEIFEKIKKLERKLIGAKEALEKTKHELARLESTKLEIIRDISFTIVEPKREWYHGFRWFITPNNFLVVGGKDAQTNDSLLRKYLDNNDIILHAEVIGGSVVLIKGGLKKVSSDDLNQAAIFAASYSRAWNIGLSGVDVFITYPQHISLHPPSGTYLKKGSFIVRKKEVIKNVELELAIGLKLLKKDSSVSTILVSAPKGSIRKNADFYIVIRPGRGDKNIIAKKIRQYFIEWLSKRLPKRIAEKLVKYEKIAELLPGPSEIVQICQGGIRCLEL